MSTATQSVAALFEKAEAIVEAEWMRLTLDDDIDEGALIQPSAEMTASRPCPPRVSTATGVLDRPGAPAPRHAERWQARRGPGPRVWASQRSPPAHTTSSRRMTLPDNGGGAPTTNTTGQRLSCRPRLL
jgi:hypothetical protein